MFEMTTSQKQAFSDGTGGISALAIDHLVLFVLGVLTILWVVVVFVGLMKGTRQVEKTLYEFGFALFIMTCVGSIIYYT